jgi:ethanolamine utilization cobalamin adenosyltransferase
MLFGEVEVKANIRNRDGKRVFYLGKGDQLTSGAKDFLSRERIPILPAEQAKPERYRLLSGGFAEEKPEHLTHLHGDVLVPKTHPRITFRGAMDTLEAEIMLCQLVLQDPWRKRLGEVLDFARMLLRCDVLEERVKEEKLCGMTAQELRQRSHRPQDFYGQAHFMPDVRDGEAILRLNRVRCAARQAELAAVAAFADREGNPTRTDILQAMNRMSSMLWILMIQMKKEL